MSVSSGDQTNTSRTFKHGETLSMFISVEGAMLSGVATIFILSYKLFFTVKRILRNRRAVQVANRPADACDSSLFLSLLAGELLRSIAASMTLRWVLEQKITDDFFCRSQGYLKLFATNAIDFSTLGITLHTFAVLVLRWTGPKFRHMAKYLTAGVWIIVVLITFITHTLHPNDLMGPNGHWCWVRVGIVVQIMSEYLWMWIIGVITAVLYGIGYFVVKPGRGSNEDDNEDVREMRRTANNLLLYPLVYLVCITPQSFGRWFFFTGFNVPYQFLLFARTVFSLSGLFNAILFFSTRYQLLKGGSSTDSISAETRREHENHAVPRESPTTSGNLGGSVKMSQYRGSSDFHPYFGSEGSLGEPSTPRREPRAGTQRASRAVDEEEDYGRLPL